MKKEIKSALITGIFGLIGTITAAIIGVAAGKDIEQKNIHNEIINITGNENNISIYDIKSLILDYQNLKMQNTSLKEQNIKYFSELTEANKRLEEFKERINSFPIINYSNLALSIDGLDIPVDINNSMITIDGRIYISKEIIEQIVQKEQSLIIQDNTLYIGKIIAEKTNLFEQWVNDSVQIERQNIANDSFGNTYSDVLYLNAEPYHKIIYALNGQYSLLKIWVAPSEQASIGNYGNIIISADGIPVYVSEELDKETAPFSQEIPINNCLLLTIEFDSEYFNDFLIYDAIVYN